MSIAFICWTAWSIMQSEEITRRRIHAVRTNKGAVLAVL
ncbi:hypothetical protein OHAE_463 [Ochrobactrum soli]|uniref:Uncharacterized protein n=1 Tax=Ochrobactrum soli TaxID=2448455 RepID=A0A2P9HKG7_9HYPH|nr:hypothetical protein OHAE_463 [[Ochrobactrum] soli]